MQLWLGIGLHRFRAALTSLFVFLSVPSSCSSLSITHSHAHTHSLSLSCCRSFYLSFSVCGSISRSALR